MVKKQEFLYLVGIVLTITRTYIDNSSLGKIIDVSDIFLLPLIIIMFLLKIINSKYEKKEFLIIVLLFFVCAFASVINSKYVILMSFVALASLKDVDINKVIKTIFITNCIFIFFYTLVYLIKLNVSPETFNFTWFYNGKVRHSFFFNHPNFYSTIIFWTLAEYLYLKKRAVNIWNYMLIICLGVFTYYYTQTRTLLVCLALMIALNVFTECNSLIFDAMLKKFVKIGFALFSILLMLIIANFFELYEDFPTIVDKIDRLLSRRISLSAMVNEKYGFSFLAQKVNYNATFSWQNKYNFNLILDNIFMQCAIVHGWIFLIIFSLLFYHSCEKIKEKRIYIYMAMAIITGIVESYILNCCICFPILIMASKLLNREEKKMNMKK